MVANDLGCLVGRNNAAHPSVSVANTALTLRCRDACCITQQIPSPRTARPPAQVLLVVHRLVEACLQYTVHLGALIDDVLRGAKAPAAQINQLRKDIAATVQSMSGGWPL